MSDAQAQVENQPYSIARRLNLARWYAERKFPDLAAGESYLALLLCDEVHDNSGECHEQALAAARVDIGDDGNDDTSDTSISQWVETRLEYEVYTGLVQSLLDCGCLKSALLFCKRAMQKYKDEQRQDSMAKLKKHIQELILAKTGESSAEDINIDNVPDSGRVRREIYPWNSHEPDRTSDETVQFLNEQLASVAPKLEVRAVDLPDLSKAPTSRVSRQLGLFTKENIAPGEQILTEKSLLTGTNRLLSEVCDACSLPCSLDNNSDTPAVCEECTDTTVFCSLECYDLAMASYHPAICDSDALSLAKDPAPNDAADTMYAQLLLRVLAMSITQDVHPLDLPEVKYLCAEFSPAATTTPDCSTSSSTSNTEQLSASVASNCLPFTFHHNIQLPIHMLEQMSINIYTATASGRYSTSIINTVYAKLRGVASAKQDISTGLPEVAAVHPLWCLANHSCAPNVKWQWDGSMRFWARDEPIVWATDPSATRPHVRNNDDDSGNSNIDDNNDLVRTKKTGGSGIKAGTEILSHYCDVGLPAIERREWAAGALGGECRCERCVWETASSVHIT